jgi:hypothetical protein
LGLAFGVSARISKGQRYQGFLRKMAGSSFGQKKGICVVQGKTFKMRKTDRISLLFGSILFLAIVLTHLRHFRWLPDGAGIFINLKKIFFRGSVPPGKKKGTRVPPGGGRARRPSKNA